MIRKNQKPRIPPKIESKFSKLPKTRQKAIDILQTYAPNIIMNDPNIITQHNIRSHLLEKILLGLEYKESSIQTRELLSHYNELKFRARMELQKDADEKSLWELLMRMKKDIQKANKNRNQKYTRLIKRIDELIENLKLIKSLREGRGNRFGKYTEEITGLGKQLNHLRKIRIDTEKMLRHMSPGDTRAEIEKTLAEINEQIKAIIDKQNKIISKNF